MAKKVSKKKEEPKNPIVFSMTGSKHVTEEEFVEFYYPFIQKALKSETPVYFIINDEGEILSRENEKGETEYYATGVGALCQIAFSSLPQEKQNIVTIYYTGDHPKVYINNPENIGFSFTQKGFTTTEERDAAMTISSTQDYHVLLGYEDEQYVRDNITRRCYPFGKYDYEQYRNGYTEFWDLMLGKNEPIHKEVSSQDTETHNTEA